MSSQASDRRRRGSRPATVSEPPQSPQQSSQAQAAGTNPTTRPQPRLSQDEPASEAQPAKSSPSSSSALGKRKRVSVDPDDANSSSTSNSDLAAPHPRGVYVDAPRPPKPVDQVPPRLPQQELQRLWGRCCMPIVLAKVVDASRESNFWSCGTPLTWLRCFIASLPIMKGAPVSAKTVSKQIATAVRSLGTETPVTAADADAAPASSNSSESAAHSEQQQQQQQQQEAGDPHDQAEAQALAAELQDMAPHLMQVLVEQWKQAGQPWQPLSPTSAALDTEDPQMQDDDPEQNQQQRQPRQTPHNVHFQGFLDRIRKRSKLASCSVGVPLFDAVPPESAAASSCSSSSSSGAAAVAVGAASRGASSVKQESRSPSLSFNSSSDRNSPGVPQAAPLHIYPPPLHLHQSRQQHQQQMQQQQACGLGQPTPASCLELLMLQDQVHELYQIPVLSVDQVRGLLDQLIRAERQLVEQMAPAASPVGAAAPAAASAAQPTSFAPGSSTSNPGGIAAVGLEDSQLTRSRIRSVLFREHDDLLRLAQACDHFGRPLRSRAWSLEQEMDRLMLDRQQQLLRNARSWDCAATAPSPLAASSSAAAAGDAHSASNATCLLSDNLGCEDGIGDSKGLGLLRQVVFRARLSSDQWTDLLDDLGIHASQMRAVELEMQGSERLQAQLKRIGTRSKSCPAGRAFPSQPEMESWRTVLQVRLNYHATSLRQCLQLIQDEHRQLLEVRHVFSQKMRRGLVGLARMERQVTMLRDHVRQRPNEHFSLQVPLTQEELRIDDHTYDHADCGCPSPVAPSEGRRLDQVD